MTQDELIADIERLAMVCREEAQRYRQWSETMAQIAEARAVAYENTVRLLRNAEAHAAERRSGHDHG